MSQDYSGERPEFGDRGQRGTTFRPIVYDAFAQVSDLHLPPGVASVWETEGWLSHLRAYGTTFNFDFLKTFNIASNIYSQFSAMVAQCLVRGEKVNVLDLGGSIGDNAYGTIYGLAPDLRNRINWTVCDGEPSMAIGRDLWNGKPFNIEFLSFDDIRRLDRRFDLCLVCGTLQYLPDPIGALSELMGLLRQGGAGIYVKRTPFCISSDHHIVIRQQTYPSYGEYAQSYIGEEQLHLLSLERFIGDLAAIGRSMPFNCHYVSCQDTMSAFPDPYRNVHYIDVLLS